MKLFITELERREGYFEMPFRSYQLLGSEQDKLVVIGDDLGGNFEICLLPKSQNETLKFVIYQTPDNFMYNTLGYITSFTTTDKKDSLQVFFNKDDINKLEILGVDIEYLDHSSSFKRTYILKISLSDEDDKIEILERNDSKKLTCYTFSSKGIHVTLINEIDIRNYKLIDNINLLKVNTEFERISNVI